MNSANLLALLVTPIAISLHECVAEELHYSNYRPCDLSTCSFVCEFAGAHRWSCEREGCMCTFLYQEGEFFSGSDLLRGDLLPGDEDNIWRRKGRKPAKKKRPKSKGRNMEEVTALGRVPMSRLLKEEDRDVLKSKVKGSKSDKTEFPFVVKGRRRSLSVKEVMDQIKKHKGSYPLEKINQFILTGGRR